MADPKHANEEEERAVISLDLGDLGTSAADTPAPDPEKIEQLSVDSGFGARAKPKTTEQPPAKTTRATKPATAKPKDRRRRSGRTHPFNTKIKPEAHQQLVEIADRLSDQEGRVVTMAEVIEKALICYEMKLAENDSD